MFRINFPIKYISLLLSLAFTVQTVSAQSKILAASDFNPRLHGFSFKNYKNENHKWQDDIAADDLVRMFGVKGACKSGTSARNCVLKEAGAQWIKEYLEAMNIGHCEGIGVASLRMKTSLPFKGRTAPFEFDTGVKSPFSMRLTPSLENYVAYYWITQTFDEVVQPTEKTAEAGPVQIAKWLTDYLKTGKDTYLLGIKKYDKGRIFDGHAVVPFAVEDDGNQYKLHVYDNNFPGETRFLFISKAEPQQWFYNGSANSNAKPDYVGNKTTETLDITATSWREGKCFRASFVKESERRNCGVTVSSLDKPFYTNAAYRQEESEDAEFFLTGEGEMLITDPNGDSIGYDPKTNSYSDEIEGAVSDILIGGLGEDLPHYTIPYQESEDIYTIVFSGKYLDEESTLDFVFSAPGFTVGFDKIRLDPNETLTATISADGEEISFTASKDGETPEVFFAFDPEEDAEASYLTLIEGVELTAGKTLFYNFDFDQGKLYFSDNDGNEDSYDIELVRVNADGTRQTYTQNDLNIGKADNYEMNFGDWEGKGGICFKDDEDGDGFGDEQCDEQPDDNTEEDFDN